MNAQFVYRLIGWMWTLAKASAVAGVCFSISIHAWSQVSKKTEPAGTVLLAIGDVKSVRNGASTVLAKGSTIQAGDAIITGNSSNAQLRMSDGAIIALRAQTEFKIDEYRFNGTADGSEKATLSLVKGGVRAVTGAIGKQNSDNLQINAVVATVGIRGTGFNLNYCQSNCVNVDKSVAKDGLYAGVFEGKITVKNEVAQDVLGVNEYLYVGGKNVMPKSLDNPPNFLPDPLAGQKIAKDKGRRGSGEIPNLAVSVSAPSKPADSQVGPPSSPLSTSLGVVVSYPPSMVSGMGIVPTSWYNNSVQGSAPNIPTGYTNYMQRAWVSAQTDLGVDGLPKHTLEAYAAGVNMTPSSASPLQINASAVLALATNNSASQAEIGGDGAYITWGRWAGGDVQVTGYNGNNPYAVSSSNGLHYIIGTLANSIPVNGTTFNLVGATTPTAVSNMQGGWLVTGGTLTINNAAINGNLGLYSNQSGGYGFFNMAFNGAVAAIGNNPVNITVNKSAGSLPICSGGCQGTGNVSFYGTTSPQAAGLAYQFNTGNNLVQGVAVFKK